MRENLHLLPFSSLTNEELAKRIENLRFDLRIAERDVDLTSESLRQAENEESDRAIVEMLGEVKS